LAARKAARHAGRVIKREAGTSEQADAIADASRAVLTDLMTADDVRVDVEQRPRQSGFAVWVYYSSPACTRR
jgi:hypothetical protein